MADSPKTKFKEIVIAGKIPEVKGAKIVSIYIDGAEYHEAGSYNLFCITRLFTVKINPGDTLLLIYNNDAAAKHLMMEGDYATEGQRVLKAYCTAIIHGHYCLRRGCGIINFLVDPKP